MGTLAGALLVVAAVGMLTRWEVAVFRATTFDRDFTGLTCGSPLDNPGWPTGHPCHGAVNRQTSAGWVAAAAGLALFVASVVNLSATSTTGRRRAGRGGQCISFAAVAAAAHWNTATQVMVESVRRLNSLDPSEYESLGDLSREDFARDDRRSLGTSQLDRLDMLGALQAYHEVGQGKPTFVFEGALRQAGDDVSLVRVDVRFESGYIMEAIHVIAVDSAGLLVRQTIFGPEQRTEADAEFERMIGEPPTDQPA